ncbi:MAG: O-methyltransferase [Acidimicrobiia bacterium]|nr:O-methyltransferase [Acidimicrobiia bacterium]
MTDAWDAVDEFVEGVLHDEDPILTDAVAAGRQAGLPEIQVSAPQAKLLHLLARAIGAKRVLEVGTLAGYSGIWLARALPVHGRLVTIEVDERHAEVARANFASAGVDERVDLRLGAGLDVLPQIAAEDLDPFDLSFIDADKPNNAAYLEWAVRLSRPGALIVLDNVVQGGAVADPTDQSGAAAAVRWLGQDPGVDATVIQTVGAKGYDGFALAVVQ